MTKVPTAGDVVEVVDPDGGRFKALVDVAGSPGLATTPIRIASLGMKLTHKSVLMLDRTIPYAPVPTPGCWSWPA
jgi:hypothetical protein